MMFFQLILFTIVGCALSYPPERNCEFCSCGDDKCDADATLQSRVKQCVANVYDEILIDGHDEDDTCLIAKKLKEVCLPRYTGKTGWVVLVGSNALFTSQMQFTSKHNITGQDYLRFTFYNKHDFEIFRPASNQAPPQDRGIIAPHKSREEMNKVLPADYIYTDMLFPRDMNFEILVDNALVASNGRFQEAAHQMWDNVPFTCSGHWVFIIGSMGILPDGKQFCAKYDYVPNTYFNATWRRVGSTTLSHQVLVFAPK